MKTILSTILLLLAFNASAQQYIYRPTGFTDTFVRTIVNAAQARAYFGISYDSTNSPTLNGTNVFTGTNRFSSVVTATNAANTFAGNGAGLTGVTGTDSTKLPLAGGTMVGVLTLPSNGLVAGTSQMVISGGKVGVGTASPGAVLHTRADSTSAIVELLRLQNGTAAGNVGNGGEITFRDGDANKVGNVTSVFTGSAWVLKLGAYANESTVTVGTGLTIGTAGTSVTNYASATATLNFASIATHDYEDLTITVTGAVVNDTVTLGLPATVLGGVVYNAWVSAANTVTVRCNNFDSGPRDPASATYRVGVTSH